MEQQWQLFSSFAGSPPTYACTQRVNLRKNSPKGHKSLVGGEASELLKDEDLGAWGVLAELGLSESQHPGSVVQTYQLLA